MATSQQSNSPQYNTISPDYASSSSETPKININSQTPEFLEKLNEYYRLKQMYQANYNDKKKVIINNPELNIRQKKNKIQKIKKNCVSCKRPVGTIFESKDHFLYAYCGNKSNKCNLNIKINRGLFVPISELISVFQSGVDENKIKIIQSKLDLLFNFNSESEIITIFNSIKQELNNDLEALLEYRTKFIDITENISNKSIIQSKMIILYEQIDVIRDSITKFNETGEVQFVKDIIVNYKDQLIPLITTLRDLKYKYYTIEESSDTNKVSIYRLIKKQFTIQDLLVAFEEPKIDSFEFGEKAIPDIQDKSLDLSKLDSKKPILEDDEIEEQNTDKENFIVNGNDLMFNKKIIANKMDFQANKSLMESQEEISPVMAHNKGYKFEMLYIRPSHPILFAIDPDNGSIYLVDVAVKKQQQQQDSDDDDDTSPPPPRTESKENNEFPGTPSGTPPQIQIDRAKENNNSPKTPSTSQPNDDEMTIVYNSDETRNIGD